MRRKRKEKKRKEKKSKEKKRREKKRKEKKMIEQVRRSLEGKSTFLQRLWRAHQRMWRGVCCVTDQQKSLPKSGLFLETQTFHYYVCGVIASQSYSQKQFALV